MRLIILILFLSGCCSINTLDDYNQRPDRMFDPELEQMYDWYLDDAEANHVRAYLAPSLVSMQFVDSFPDSDEAGDDLEIDYDDKNMTIGECQIDMDWFGHRYTSIYVLSSAWNRDEPYRMRALVYHELTHCIFRLEHSKIRGSIMYPILEGGEDYWSSAWDFQLEQLFVFIKNKGEE